MRPIQNGYVARPVRDPEDVGALAALLRACELATFGEIDTIDDDIVDMIHRPNLDLARDTAIVTDGTGAVAAYGQIWNRRPGTEVFSEGWVHPDHRGKGIGTWIFEWSEERAGAFAMKAGCAITNYNVGFGTDEPFVALARERGYEPYRRDWRMRITLDDQPPVPIVPEGFRIEPVNWERDAEAVHATFMESFAEHRNFAARPFDEWNTEMRGHTDFDPALWWLVRDDSGEPAAAIASAVRADGDGFVATLGVRKRFRGRGLGDALLRLSFAELARRGCRRVFLDVDSDNTTGARQLYERAGMEPIREFAFFRKPVEPA